MTIGIVSRLELQRNRISTHGPPREDLDGEIRMAAFRQSSPDNLSALGCRCELIVRAEQENRGDFELPQRRHRIVVRFGLVPNDPWMFASASAVLAGTALIAGYLPARRASSVNPIEALRDE